MSDSSTASPSCRPSASRCSRSSCRRSSRRSRRARREPIAIVGIGCRFPGGARSPDAFWQLLRAGGDAISEVPRDRWDVDALLRSRSGRARQDVDALGRLPRRRRPLRRRSSSASRRARRRAWIRSSGCCSRSPGRRWRTRAGARSARPAARTGVFVGMLQRRLRPAASCAATRRGLDAYVATGGAHSVAAGRLSYLLGLQGPSVAIDTACSSSLVAVHLACQSLRSGECRTGAGRRRQPDPLARDHDHRCRRRT